MVDTKDLFRSFLWMGIGAIAITAVWAVGIVLFGTFTEIQIKFILTTLVLGFYCLTFVATVGEGREHMALMIGGSIAALWGLWATLPLIWWPLSYYDQNVGKDAIALAVAAFAIALGSINFRLSARATISIILMGLTNLLVALVSWMFIWLIMTDFANAGEGTVRLLIASGILGVAGTITNPIVAKLTRA